MPPTPSYGIPDTVQYPAIAICAALALASLAFCVVVARRGRSMLPLYLFAAGALTVFFEPYPDLLGLAVFPQEGQVHWISAFGRDIPMYIGLTYMFYWAPAWLVMVDQLQRGVTPRRYWALCGVMVAATCAIELIPLHFRMWEYYGSQPLRLGGFPLWWGFINGHSFIASSVVLVLLLRVLPANRRFLLVILMPAVVLAVHTGGAMAGYSTVASTANPVITWLGTLGSMAFCTLLCWVYSLVVCQPGATLAVGGRGATRIAAAGGVSGCGARRPIGVDTETRRSPAALAGQRHPATSPASEPHGR